MIMNEHLHRLSTFENWSSDVSPLQLAKCGFYYTGRDDTVKCYRCPVTLREWRPGDNPLIRHQRSNPDCPVATNTDTLNATVVTAHGLQRLISSLEADDVRGMIPSVIRSSSDELSLQNLRMYSFRLETFHDWPINDVVTDVSLARAGFYYTGYNDKVRCAFCRREVSDWQPGDVPTEEHRRLVPYCAFVKQNFCFPTQSSATSPRTASEQQQQHANEQVWLCSMLLCLASLYVNDAYEYALMGDYLLLW